MSNKEKIQNLINEYKQRVNRLMEDSNRSKYYENNNELANELLIRRSELKIVIEDLEGLIYNE